MVRSPKKGKALRRLVHALLCATSFLSVAWPVCRAQQAAQTAVSPDPSAPAFEVAVIRLVSPGSNPRWIGTRLSPSGRLQGSSLSLESLVRMAYLADPQLAKVDVTRTAPKWIGSDRFDVEAKIEAAYLTGWNELSYDRQMAIIRPMLQRLLAERFHLKVAVESRLTPVYALVQAKGGAHVKEVPPPPPVEGDASQAMDRWIASNPGKTYPGSVMCSGDRCFGHAIRINVALPQIASNSHADRMVVDQTGLAGTYDLSFSFPDEKVEFPMQEIENDLGMKFRATSLPVKTYIVLSADQPSVD